MERSIIDSVAAAGFDVWMRDPKDSWMLFTDGKNIGYLQADRLAGYTISTVHMPNTTTGTGFQIERHVADFSRDKLAHAFVIAPTWAGGRERESVRKYRGIKHYRAANSFNAAYRLVAAADRSEPTYANQLWQARKMLAEKGAESLNNPHAMIGRTCGCKTCFCCAAAEVYAQRATLEG